LAERPTDRAGLPQRDLLQAGDIWAVGGRQLGDRLGPRGDVGPDDVGVDLTGPLDQLLGGWRRRTAASGRPRGRGCRSRPSGALGVLGWVGPGGPRPQDAEPHRTATSRTAAGIRRRVRLMDASCGPSANAAARVRPQVPRRRHHPAANDALPGENRLDQASSVRAAYRSSSISWPTVCDLAVGFDAFLESRATRRLKGLERGGSCPGWPGADVVVDVEQGGSLVRSAARHDCGQRVAPGAGHGLISPGAEARDRW
jgi:hypothetical protein